MGNVRNFIEGNAKYALYSHLPLAEREQAFYRSFLCEECLTNTRCVVCNCTTPNMFFAPSKTCSKERWDAMLPPKEWLQYKELNGIEINLDNGTIRPNTGGSLYALPAGSRDFYPVAAQPQDSETETVLGDGSLDGQSIEVLQPTDNAVQRTDSEGLPEGSRV